MKMPHLIVHGDSRQMRYVDDKSAQLIITSPPYWQLKDYGAEHQIGFHESYEEYINNLNIVWSECERALSPGCRLCVNVGDQFARAVHYGRYKVIPIRSEIIRFCEHIGLDYMGAIIWQKTTTCNTTGGGAVMGSFPYPRNGVVKIDYEFILLFKKLGLAPPPSPAAKEASAMTSEEWNRYFSGHWNFAGARQVGHLAMFPQELPMRLIKMFSFHGEMVLDPFLGSGTTALAASSLGRRSVGYEINADFIPHIRRKLNADGLFSDDCSFVADTGNFDREQALSALPYLFRDPHSMDKLRDPRTASFGSKIDMNSMGLREHERGNNFHSVKEVLSPVRLRLNNGTTVRLLGLRENKKTYDAAIDFLTKKAKGKKITLTFDKQQQNNDSNLLCYVHLQNKTFINAHLIKEKLVTADRQAEHKYRDKFLQLEVANG
ncbi:MAG: DNA methyltransferase [Salinispira sp.]